MKKSDLKSGMVVELRDWKDKMLLIDDVFCSATGENFLELSNYDDNLKHNYNDRFDIIEIYKCKHPNIMSCFLGNKLELIWEREEVKYTDYRQAVEFDKNLCTTIAMEECSELIQAISKAKRGKLDKDNMAEEIADVLISIEWIKEVYEIRDIDVYTWIDKKKERILNRLNTGEFK